MCILLLVAGLAVFVDTVNVTDWFNAANLTDEEEHRGVTLTKTNTTQIEVSFKSSENNVP